MDIPWDLTPPPHSFLVDAASLPGKVSAAPNPVLRQEQSQPLSLHGLVSCAELKFGGWPVFPSGQES